MEAVSCEGVNHADDRHGGGWARRRERWECKSRQRWWRQWGHEEQNEDAGEKGIMCSAFAELETFPKKEEGGNCLKERDINEQ